MTLARRLQLGIATVAGAIFVIPIAFVVSRLHFGEAVTIAPATYAGDAAPTCVQGSRDGPAGVSDREATAQGVRFAVRTPSNYRATVAHPLIVVYAPRGANRFLVERFVGLTHDATAAGFVIAFVDARELSHEAIDALAEVPTTVAARWCIDLDRISLTGHSDGGTTAEVIAFRAGTRGQAAAVAPSAAGIRGEDLADESCPEPLPIMIWHAQGDGLFPGYGAGAAAWWAACNGCAPDPGAADASGCRAYSGCREGAATILCEPEGGHLDWLVEPGRLIEFFAAARRRDPNE